jgi:threonylcarbamoyladenosine tRNA methylthiotransferase MtaB
MSLRVSFQTFGCKLNQLETESLADAFARAGDFVEGGAEGPAFHEADLHVINTCTVTSKAEQKARRSIRAALAAGPRATVLVTGCYAQVDAAALEALDCRVVVVPGEEKGGLHQLPGWLEEHWQGHGELAEALREWRAGRDPDGEVDRFSFSPESFAFHSRPSLKVQDGCGNRCTYCRVCIARGPSASLPAALALERLRGLEALGAAEAVLTGVNLSQYRSEGRDFAGLLAFLLAGTSKITLRLSSYEPDRLDEPFLEVFSEPRVRPHVHLSVQSGSDAVLARMGRRYDGRRVLEACEALRRVRGDPFIGADLIAGFPGETDADAGETLALAEAAGFAWIHAFPFSARPGTAAFAMKPRVPERTAGERVDALCALAERGRRAYVGRWLGREVEAVLEGHVGDGGRRRATSGNYLRLELRGEDAGPGSAGSAIEGRRGASVRCRVETAADSGEADAVAGILPIL